MTAVLVAAAGGHLAQLQRLVPRLPGVDDRVWVTFDSAQSRSSLRGERVEFVSYPRPRDVVRTTGHFRAASRVLRSCHPSVVVSTGSSIAVPFLALAARHCIPSHYIESATRVESPSLTGRILERVPGVDLYTQSPDWHRRRWHHRGSVFDGFVADDDTNEVDVGGTPIRRAVVTVGSARDYGFRRLVEWAADALPADADVLWQTGATDVGGLAIDARVDVPGAELAAAIRRADVVIAHAGIGSALSALEAGHCPVLVPRDPVRGEHVDGHQLPIARALDRRGLAVVATERLRPDDLALAASRRVRTVPAPEFGLD
jgi:UDP-N-acetylglucosamine transferase subunit ALG13